MVRIRLNKQLEKSINPFSIIKSDINNEAIYTNPTNAIPTPIISLGENYVLQHNRNMSINDLMTNTYASTSKGNSISQTGNDWANSDINIGIAFGNDNYDFFLANKPMIFLEVYSPKGNRKRKIGSNKGDFNASQWIHPTNANGELNRNGSNYGNGTVSTLITEWDLIVNEAYTNQQVDINPKGFYVNFNNLPQRKVDWSFDNGKQLKYIHRGGFATGNLNKVLSYKQSIRFRFACIDPRDNKSVILGNFSEKIILSPKGGYFGGDNEYYWYDFQANFE